MCGTLSKPLKKALTKESICVQFSTSRVVKNTLLLEAMPISNGSQNWWENIMIQSHESTKADSVVLHFCKKCYTFRVTL